MQTKVELIAKFKAFRQRQQGSALLVTIILLLMLSVVVFFGVKTGLSEQRTAVNREEAKRANGHRGLLANGQSTHSQAACRR